METETPNNKKISIFALLSVVSGILFFPKYGPLTWLGMLSIAILNPWSLYSWILFYALLGFGILICILGVIGLVKIKHNRQLKGKVLAVLGIILGGISIAYNFMLLLALSGFSNFVF